MANTFNEWMTRSSSRLLLTTLSVILTLALTLPSCRPSPRTLVAVSGKTVYQGMALEGVNIAIYRWEKIAWNHYADTQSGYHGSFRFDVPAGKYNLVAKAALWSGSLKTQLEGRKIVKLEIDGPGERMDRVVIEMSKAPGT